MTAWQILTQNSTAPASATAWVHLMSQSGEGGGQDIFKFAGGFSTVFG